MYSVVVVAAAADVVNGHTKCRYHVGLNVEHCTEWPEKKLYIFPTQNVFGTDQDKMKRISP